MEGEFRKVAARTTDSHQERTLMLVSEKNVLLIYDQVSAMESELNPFEKLLT